MPTDSLESVPMKRSQAKSLAIWTVAPLAMLVSGWYIATSFHWPDVAALLRNAHAGWLVLAALTIPAYWATRTARWLLLLRRLHVNVAPTQLYFVTSISLGFSTVTPVQSGEVLKVEWLKRAGVCCRTGGYGSFFVERVLDFCVVLLMALLGLTLKPLPGIPRLAGFIVIGLLLVGLGFCLLNGFIQLSGRLGRLLHEMFASFGTAGTAAAVVLLTVLGWALTAAGWYCVLASIGTEIGYADVLLLVSLVTLLALVACVPGAVGVGEAGASWLLIQFGQAAAQAQAGALALRAYGIMILVLALLHCLLWRWLRPTKAPPLRATPSTQDSLASDPDLRA